MTDERIKSEAYIKRNILKQNLLFAGVTEDELSEIEKLTWEQDYSAGDYIIHEADLGNELFIIVSGQVEILKKLTNLENDQPYTIATLTTGESIGEVALLEHSMRIASARAITDTKLFVIPIQELQRITSYEIRHASLRDKIIKLVNDLSQPSVATRMALNLARNLTNRLFNTNLVAANALQEALTLSQMRASMGQFIISLICTLVIYTYFLSMLSRLEADLQVRSILIFSLTGGFVLAALYFMKTSGYSRIFFGVTFEHWLKHSVQGIIWSIPVLFLIVGLKYLVILYLGINVPIFEWSHGILAAGVSRAELLFLITAYCLIVPVQELIARGAIQGALQNFIVYKHNVAVAVVVSSLIFSMIHLHLSVQVAFAVFLLGLFWGSIYARQRSLVGVSVSHLLIGVWAQYVVGVFTILNVPP